MIKKFLLCNVLMALPVILSAQAQQPSADARSTPMGTLMTFFPILVFGAIFYFLLFRPQQQANKERQKMLSSVKRNDKVLTAGGLYGQVVGIRGDILDVKVSDNVKVEINRTYVAKVIALSNGVPEANPQGKNS